MLTLAFILGSIMFAPPLWLWILPVLLFISLGLDSKRQFLSGIIFIIAGVFLTIWDFITGMVGFPWFHLIIIVGGVSFLALWWQERKMSEFSSH